ncbi:hypothetical protein QBC43DRAFT_316855 [Cladorrhinum sp. PSN259]|nr:hypothetical protein QBC43DRAFT_316855 [Cladorrhinum sp. PSN259]
MASSLVRAFIAASWLLAGGVRAAVYEQRRYAATAIETAHPVFMPRVYYEAAAQPLKKRQNGVCQAGSHPCNELGPLGEAVCCPNNQYCMVNVNNPTRASCCQVGATCNNQPASPCSEPDFFLCQTTVTTTVSDTRTTSLSSACCPRPCTIASQYQCPSNMGGKCCPNTQQCGVGGNCLSTLEPSTTPLLTPVPEGCSQGQISCPAELGGGCCGSNQVCTKITGSAHCALKTNLPGGVDVIDSDGKGGLSTGAKAGIGVGVVVVAGLVIGLVTWFCLRRRRRNEGESSAGGGRVRVRPGQTIGGAENRLEGYSDAGVSSRPGGGIGTQGYGGGGPALGPYSDEFRGTGPSPPSAVTSPGMEYSRVVGGGTGAVPVIPEGPGDIATAVEIDSGENGGGGARWEEQEYQGQGGHSRGGSQNTAAQGQAQQLDGYFASGVVGGGGGRPRAETNLSQGTTAEDMSDRFELYGSDPGQLSPLSSPYGHPSPPEEYNGHNHQHGRR